MFHPTQGEGRHAHAWRSWPRNEDGSQVSANLSIGWRTHRQAAAREPGGESCL